MGIGNINIHDVTKIDLSKSVLKIDSTEKTIYCYALQIEATTLTVEGDILMSFDINLFSNNPDLKINKKRK